MGKAVNCEDRSEFGFCGFFLLFFLKNIFCLCLTGLLALCTTSQVIIMTEPPSSPTKQQRASLVVNTQGPFPILLRCSAAKICFPLEVVKFFRLWVSTDLLSYHFLLYTPNFSNASNVESFKTQQNASTPLPHLPHLPHLHPKMFMEGL